MPKFTVIYINVYVIFFTASFVKTCRRKEPDLAKCLLEQTVESIKPHLPVGS